MKNIFYPIFIAAILQPLLVSCVGDMFTPREDPTRYYVISSCQKPEIVEGARGEMLNVSQVRLPSYMARQQIVSAKMDSSEIIISDIYRLPEYPVDAFTRVITTNISKIARSENVYAYPGIAPDENAVSLRVIVVECLGVVGGELDFKARWELIRPEGSKVVGQTAKLFIAKIPAGNDYEGYVKAIDKALCELSLDIVKGLVNFNSGLEKAKNIGVKSE